MPPKKQKGQKLALTDFFKDTDTGASWADEMEAMPTAPAARDPGAPRRGEPGYFESLPDRGGRGAAFPGNAPPREELPLPTAPPYTAFVGNLTFETDEAELSDFFSDLQTVSVKTIKDATGKAKGFGYVEFKGLEDLKTALGKSGLQLGGRTVRISVAEAPANRRDASAAEESNQWRRSGPLPTRAVEAAPGRRVPSYAGSEREPRMDQPDRDWGAARGAKFVASSNTNSGPPSPNFRRESSGPGFVREGSGPGFVREGSGPGFVRERDIGGPTGQADEASAWRSSKPLAEVRGQGRDAPPHQRAGGSPAGPTSPGLADTEQTWSRGSKLRTPVAPSTETVTTPSETGTNSPAEDRDWRNSRATSAVPSAGSRGGSVSGESSPAVSQQATPAARQRLQLAPRSSTTSTPVDSPVAPPAASKASPFGAARPIDTSTREQEAAAKLAAREEERKKARAEEEKKVKDEAERRLAAASAAAASASSGAPAAAGQSGDRVSHGNRNGDSKRVHPSRKSSNPNVNQSSTNGSKKDSTTPTAAAANSQPKKETKKKESTVRPAFSFAAAAGKLGLLEGDGDEEVEEKAEEEKEVKKDAEVEEVTKKVAEVEV